MTTKSTLAYFQAKYPDANFNLIDSSEIISHFEEEELKDKTIPKDIITFEYEGMCMFDPYASDCSRFRVPSETYNIEDVDAKKMVKHNQLSLHG